MKAMSIIGIVWFSLCFILILAFLESDLNAAAGAGLLGMLYAIPFAIAGLVNSTKKETKEVNVTQELLKLHELKEKGILSEEEFQVKKLTLLKI